MMPLNFSHKNSYQRGFSIVEMLIAMLVGLFLIGGIVDIFLSSRQTSSLQISLSKIQQDGRRTINILTTDIRMADYSACYSDLSAGVENTLNNPTKFAWDLSSTVQGFNNVSNNFTISDSESGGVISDILAGTDVLVIKGMTDGVPISTNPDNATLTIDATLNKLHKGEILIVANCEHASMFQASAVTSTGGVTTIKHATGLTPGNSTASVTNSFGADAEIARLSSSIYYLKNDASGNPGMFQSSLEINADGTIAAMQENQLVSNVENMQIQYGVDTDNDQDVDVYQNADNVADMATVMSIRIALLLVSGNDNLIETKESYSFNANTFTFSKDASPANTADRKLRRTFTGFVALRNRTL
jgi:type IV pilus assembly protein PilW